MTQSNATSVGRRSHPAFGHGTPPARCPRFEALSAHLVAAVAALTGDAPDAQARRLDEAAERLRRVEILLEELARDADLPSEDARKLRWARDAVSGHLSAAASLRLLDLNANASLVLRRAVDSVRDQMTSINPGPRERPVVDA